MIDRIRLEKKLQALENVGFTRIRKIELGLNLEEYEAMLDRISEEVLEKYNNSREEKERIVL